MPYIGNTVQNQGFTPAIDYFSGNGVTVTFTLSRPIVSASQMIVAVDNVIQNPSTAFTVSGSSITFTSAPLSGTNNIWVEYTSLITTYNAISQDPSVIGDITASGGFLATGDFGNSYIDGLIADYVTGAARITTGPIDDIVFYHGGSYSRSEIMRLSYTGAIGVGSSTSYGTSGQILTSQGSSSAPTWSNSPVYAIDYLIVAGGGAGGGSYVGGGGGAGGYLAGSTAVTSGTTYSLVIGAGGTGTSAVSPAANGSNSTGFTLTAIGGGGGGVGNNNTTVAQANSGGSGGGSGAYGSPSNFYGSGTSGQGNRGGSGYDGISIFTTAGGGGGAGAVGGNSGTSTSNTSGGAGGAGLNWQSLGTYYAGGGGGGTDNGGGSFSGSGGAGGAGGGGTGGNVLPSNIAATSGAVNTGGGGGGSTRTLTTGGSGGSGIVIVRYAGSTRGSGGTITSAGGYTYHTFTTSGTFTA